MKSVLSLLVLVTAFSAQAVVRPGWERPIAQARLIAVDGKLAYPQPESLTLNRRDGILKKASSFTLVEDTGVRCFTTPCPSSVTTQFKIVSIDRDKYNSIVYQAVEVKTLPNTIGPMKRVLTVIDRRQDNGNYEFGWEVSLRHYGHAREFRGNPTPVFTAQ
jgi:hypothetical protein